MASRYHAHVADPTWRVRFTAGVVRIWHILRVAADSKSAISLRNLLQLLFTFSGNNLRRLFCFLWMLTFFKCFLCCVLCFAGFQITWAALSQSGHALRHMSMRRYVKASKHTWKFGRKLWFAWIRKLRFAAVYNVSVTTSSGWKNYSVYSQETSLQGEHCHQMKFSLCSRYSVEAYKEWRGPSPRRSVWATQLRRNITAVTIRWRHCVQYNPLANRTHDLPRRKRCF